MENSSYSKTRSPARFLAAFLAVVMLLIVMPVLPVGAGEASNMVKNENEFRATAVTLKTFKVVFSDTMYVIDQDGENIEELTKNGKLGQLRYTSVSSSTSEGKYTVTFTVDSSVNRLGMASFTVITEGNGVNVSYNETEYDVSSGDEVKIPASAYSDKEEFTVTLTENEPDPIVTVKGYETNSNFSIPGWVRGQDHVETVASGSDFSFTLSPNANYPAPKVTWKKASGETQETVILPNAQNVYTVQHVTESIEITITPVTEKIKYKVFFASDGFDILFEKDGRYSEVGTSGTEFDAGTNVNFKVQTKEGYTGTPTVYANGQLLTSAGDNIYTIPQISSNTTLTVNGITVQTFRVSFPSDTTKGYTVSPNSETVEWKGTAVFTVTVATGYKYDKETIVLGGGEVTKKGSSGGDNVYSVKEVNDSTFEITVENVTKALNLSITGGVTVITYTVSADVGTGKGYKVEFQGDGGTVNHGGTVSFTVAPEEGYYISSVYLLLNGKDETGGTRVLSPSGGSYTIENVTRDYKVVVEAKLISVTVTFQLQSSANLNDKSGSQQMTYTTKNAPEGAFTRNGAGFYTLDLSKLEPKRKGWKFTRWSDFSNGARVDSVTVYNGQTASITVSPVWSVDTSNSSETAFFYFTVNGTHDGGRDMVSVVVNSNVKEPDEDVVVSTYGIVYGVNDAFETYRSSLTTATFSSGTYNGWNSIGTGIGYWLFDGENAGTDAYDGGNFSFKSKHVSSDGCGRSAMAFIVVRIGNETCLFLSEVKPIALSGVGG